MRSVLENTRPDRCRHHCRSRRTGTPPDPAAAEGTQDEIRRAFEITFDLLSRRIEALLQLPLDHLEREAQWRELMRIGEIR